MHDLSHPARRPVDLRSLSFAVVDVETTGGRVYGGDRIMEVAVVHVKDGVASTAAEFLVDPQRPIPPFVSKLTGIRWEMVHEAPTFGDVADQIQAALEGHIFVAHNVRFDWRFLSMELQRSTGRPLRGDRLCTVKFARKLLTHLRRRSLDALSWHYEVPIRARHRAGGDARATAEILLRMFADARRQDIDTWEQLTTFIRRPAPRAAWSYLPQPVRVENIA